jgi:hypothetical protein
MRLLPAAFVLLVAHAAHAKGGFYSEANFGATLFLGKAADSANPGPQVGARLGYGPWSWIHFGIMGSASTHEATVPPPPQGEYFQLYHLGGDLRLKLKVWRLGFFAEGSGGIAIVSTNILDRVELTSPTRHHGPYIQAGGGWDYHTANPRFALGMAGDYTIYPDFGAMQSLQVRVYLRYTK